MQRSGAPRAAATAARATDPGQSVGERVAGPGQKVLSAESGVVEEYEQAIQAKPALAERAALINGLCPGIGPSGKAVTALVGVVPWAADSGRHRGYRAIRGGRGLVRRALYMAALSVVRTDTDLGRFYQRLRQRGKPGKVALVAVMGSCSCSCMRLRGGARRGSRREGRPSKKGLTSNTDTPDILIGNPVSFSFFYTDEAKTKDAGSPIRACP